MFYDYICEDCNVVEEQSHGMTETPIINCPKCGKQMKRIIYGGSGVIFKGSGWAGKNSVSGVTSKTERVTQKVKMEQVAE